MENSRKKYKILQNTINKSKIKKNIHKKNYLVYSSRPNNFHNLNFWEN